MTRTLLLPALLATAGLFLLPTKADAWGAAHYNYTRVGPGGVYNTNKTVVSTPFGVRATGNTSYSGYGGTFNRGYSYGGGYGYGGGYHYNYGTNYNTGGYRYRYGYGY